MTIKEQAINTLHYPHQIALSFLAALLLSAVTWSSPAPAAAAPLNTPPALSSGSIQVSVNEYHTCTLKSDGSIACWGDNSSGKATPPSPNSGFTQVSTGGAHTCALKSDGSIACWGNNDYGQTTPPTPNSNFTQVSAGGGHTCALKSDSSVICWGDNGFGLPTLPIPNSGFSQVSAGMYHTCAVKNDSSIVCWGWNEYGQVSPLPTPNSGFTQVSTGRYHTCAVKSDSSIACWGYNEYGLPALPTPNSGFTQISAGMYYTCGVKGDGSIVCWGENWVGQSTPPTPNSGFIQVSAGAGYTCAVYGDGSLACWGGNSAGQAPTINLSLGLPASITYGDSYTQDLTATGGPGGGPYTFDVIAGALPPGLVLPAGGTLSGTPTQAGSYSFTLRMQDAIRYTSTQDYTLDVSRAPLTVRADDLTRDFGTPNPPLSYSFIGLKNGDGPGVVSGTPPLLETDATTSSLPGTYEIRITPGSLTAQNYEIIYASGWLNILDFSLFLPAVLR